MAKKIYEIKITADHNDADYIAETNDIDMKTIEKFLPLIDAIKNYSGVGARDHYNWNNCWDRRNESSYFLKAYSQFREDLLNEFNECYVPGDEYGVHTITDIIYYEKPKNIVTLL